MPLVVLVLALAACRDDDGPGGITIVTGVTSNVTTLTPDTTSTTTSTTASGSEGASGSTSTTDPVDATSSSGSTTTTTGDETTAVDVSSTTMTGPVDPVAACLEKVDPGDECSACICTDCLDLWNACHDDQGCAIIQECAQESSCYGIDCLDACETTINLWGGIGGTSFGLWHPMTNCLEATCRPLCPW
ncbi:hypothetical protein [Nannocystis sp. SCPEA4]|uniref:hypothetical protein n=1 Tax=Nannocystis sp. SCPEA4 TaxID=2996787 RepID=UPI00226E8F16|nr:hypothetical protein [Nannocystis sp. SCPEA4]MCY1057103.1 hypothetical protein [Nannocystis sp. SCPEA4]